MIYCKELNKDFDNKYDLFKALKDNKKSIVKAKKMITKQADAVCRTYAGINKEGANKAEGTPEDVNSLDVELVINTTKLMDSHNDVHLNGIWNKTVKDNKNNLLLLKEHKMTFENIISDKVVASVKTFTWKDLGFNMEGSTEALVFEATIDKDRNEFMFKQYAKGYVKEHSVGMRYVRMDLAVNSEDKYFAEEKEIWDKYIDQVANKKDAEEEGYFWAVLEAKAIEGSAVVKGSNYATPTISVEPSNDTQENKEAVSDDTSQGGNSAKYLLI